MKRIIKTIYLTLLTGILTLTAGCDSKLDIVPRGMSTLSTVDELASLLNIEWIIFDNYYDFEYLNGNLFPYFQSPDEVLLKKNTVNYAFVFGDEAVDRVALCDTDDRYSELYRNINYCNIVIEQMPNAKGDNSLRSRYLAQAHILRAYFHFIAVNFFAGQYDPTTAADLGGIAYVDNSNSGETKVKLSVAEVYNRILADCTDELIEELAVVPTDDPFRFEADFGYAVRANVLFQMKRYDEALLYARKALEINSDVADRSQILQDRTWVASWSDSNNYFFLRSTNVLNMSELCFKTFTPELMSLYEEGDYVRYYSQEDDWIDYEQYCKGAPGSYIYSGSSGRINTFGINSEMMHYLAAECLIRQGNIDEGLGMVDKVRKFRIHPSKFTPFKGSVSSRQEAIALLRKAKRLEFLGNYMNFLDNKRFNSEPENAQDITHYCGESGTFTIHPDSPLWIYPFPVNATSFNPTLTQNI